MLKRAGRASVDVDGSDTAAPTEEMDIPAGEPKLRVIDGGGTGSSAEENAPTVALHVIDGEKKDRTVVKVDDFDPNDPTATMDTIPEGQIEATGWEGPKKPATNATPVEQMTPLGPRQSEAYVALTLKRIDRLYNDWSRWSDAAAQTESKTAQSETNLRRARISEQAENLINTLCMHTQMMEPEKRRDPNFQKDLLTKRDLFKRMIDKKVILTQYEESVVSALDKLDEYLSHEKILAA